MRDAVLAILAAAAEDERVLENLKDVRAGRALLRFTDTQEAIEFQAGDGTPARRGGRHEGQGTEGRRDERDLARSARRGTLKPWLAFTRGMVIARAGLIELRWLQQVAERLQKAYEH